MRAEEDDGKGAQELNLADSIDLPFDNRLRIAEIYTSRQGEGRWTGAPSVFLRTSGCNLRCWFCDTPFASWKPEGTTQSVEDVIHQVLALPAHDVVITGGEPLLYACMSNITRQLRAAGRRVTIETAGTVNQDFECDLLSISPKLSSSAPDRTKHPAWHARHHARRNQIDLVRQWIERYDYQLKFVIAKQEDIDEVQDYLAQLQNLNSANVWLMPEGTSTEILDNRARWLKPYCNQHGFKFCERSHIYWYGNRRGT